MARRRGLHTLIVKVIRLWGRESLPGVLRALKSIAHDYGYYSSYRNWFRDYGTLQNDDRAHIRQHIKSFAHKPTISILIPTCNAGTGSLRRVIDSVRAQLYPHWELCIVHDNTDSPQTKSLLDEFRQRDERIRLACGNGLGSALDIATGDFVTLLDHRGALAEHALYLVAEALEHDPALDMFYSDEDKVNTAGQHDAPCFKPDWNPDLFLSRNIVSRLGIFRYSRVRAVGGFRPGFGDAQAWDLALRISETIFPKQIRHLPYVLYHQHTSTEAEDASVLAGGMKVISEHLIRTNHTAEVSLAGPAGLRIRYALPEPPPLVSIIIPTRNGQQLLKRCIDSIHEKTAYASYEIIIVDNQSDDPASLAYFAELALSGDAHVLKYDAPFNYADINNRAAHTARGSLLCLLNNDIEVISADWLGEMVSQAMRPEIGAVGALLYYPDDTIQHAGVIVGMSGCADHPYAGTSRGCTGMMGRACLVQNLSAVTAACLVIRKEIYSAVGGFDAENLPVSFNDVDFCLRVIELGYRNLWTPFAELYHHESASRGPEDTPAKQKRAKNEAAYMRKRWPQFMENDPAFNPNLSLGDKWPRQGANPRVRKPWLTG